MAAGLGFKDFTTGEVLTAADVDGYLMQGIWVFASAAARDAAVTSPQEGNFAFTKDNNSLWYYDGATWVASGATGDIEGVTAGIGISGGGTSGTVTITNSMATAIDAKGDLVVGTGADTFSRLGVGTNGYTLVADSAEATGLKWAAAGGGTTVIASGTFPSSASTYTFSSIPTTYKYLILQFQSIEFTSNNAPLGLRIGTKTDGHYGGAQYWVGNTSAQGNIYSNNASNLYMADNRYFSGMITFPCYYGFDSTYDDMPIYWTITAVPNNRDNFVTYQGGGFVTGTQNYTQFTIGDFSGTRNIGGQYQLLGVN